MIGAGVTAGSVRPAGFAGRVVAWQRTQGRHHLPWQRADAIGALDAYRVWVSEVMLQQTQVQTVLGYYERFMARFPDVQALAAAPLDDVLAHWSGLGYYARARMLHRAAQQVVADHGGRFPRDAAAIARLPGIGRSTAAAIASLAHGERAAIRDGNVKRVLAFAADLALPKALNALWQEAEALLPADAADMRAYTQGLMDLGATVCLQRSPHCLICPVRDLCRAAAEGDSARYPVKSRRLVRTARESLWLDLRWKGRIFLVQRPATGIWAGLWSLPEFDTRAAFDAVGATWPGQESPASAWPAFTHVLTHLDWRLVPVRWELAARTSAARVASLTSAWPNGAWYTPDEALALGLPSPLRKRLAAEPARSAQSVGSAGSAGSADGA